MTPERRSWLTLLEPLVLDPPTPLSSELIQRTLADESSAAFGITGENARNCLEERSHHLRQVYPALQSFCRDRFGWSACPLDLVWRLWLPLALELVACRKMLKRPIIQGILGGQGTGKTTLAAILLQILPLLGYHGCSLSIDDLYKTYIERCQLQQSDPRLRWRGPPGTHDIALGLAVLKQLRAGSDQPIAIPRFDKSAHRGAGDRTTPELVTAVDIILFEGWFVGVRPLEPAAFETAPSPIETLADRQFARDINTRLQDYLPLWNLLDRLIVLHPADYRFSLQWRQQAEHDMIAQGKSGMNDAEIAQFVEYFWRSLHPELFLPPLLHTPDTVDLVIEINAAHEPDRIYKPV